MEKTIDTDHQTEQNCVFFCPRPELIHRGTVTEYYYSEKMNGNTNRKEEKTWRLYPRNEAPWRNDAIGIQWSINHWDVDEA